MPMADQLHAKPAVDVTIDPDKLLRTDRVKEKRLALGCSITVMAARAGMKSRQWRDIEGRRWKGISVVTLAPPAMAIGCSPMELIDMPEPLPPLPEEGRRKRG